MLSATNASMSRSLVHVLDDLVASVSALVRESGGAGYRTPELADRLPERSPRQRAAEEWFLECITQLAMDSRTAYPSPADAVLSVRQQVRVAAEQAGLPADQSDRIIVLATDAAMDVLFDGVHSPRGPRRH
jgi:hypothetical protein